MVWSCRWNEGGNESSVLGLPLVSGAIVAVSDGTPFEGDAWPYCLKQPRPSSASGWMFYR